MQNQQYVVTVPPNIRPGQQFRVLINSQEVMVTCPRGVKPGQRVTFQLPPMENPITPAPVTFSFRFHSWSWCTRALFVESPNVWGGSTRGCSPRTTFCFDCQWTTCDGTLPYLLHYHRIALLIFRWRVLRMWYQGKKYAFSFLSCWMNKNSRLFRYLLKDWSSAMYNVYLYFRSTTTRTVGWGG